ncbi:MAG: hypothetical protein NVSMB62_05480 [Acidobacteriaceae bacterium]
MTRSAADISLAPATEERQTGPPSLDLERMYAFLLQSAQLDPHIKPGPQLAAAAHSIFRVATAAIFESDLREVYRAGRPIDNLEDIMQSIYYFETSADDLETGLIRRVLRMGKLPIGALLVRGEINALTADAIACVISITFDRFRAFANESRTESARRTEQMRTTVLDSLAHAYKTPLAAIEAASGGLTAMGNLSVAQSELMTLIEEQAAELSSLTTRLLKTARLETGALVPKSERVAIAPLIEDVVASLRSKLATFSIKIELSHDELSVDCDRDLLVTLLTQYLDNAGKYADAGTPITVQAVEKPTSIVLSVHNFGPPIPMVDCERVFDRYYRCAAHSNRAPGTGIGLSIAKRAALAHDGQAWVTSDEKRGTRFYVSLPRKAHSKLNQ